MVVVHLSIMFLEGVTMLLRALPFDINAVALEMSKTLFPLLESSHESLRKDTIALLAVIVQKCSSADAHSDLLSLAKERLCNSKRLTPSQRVVHVEGRSTAVTRGQCTGCAHCM